jgi:hypothetical protein
MKQITDLYELALLPNKHPVFIELEWKNHPETFTKCGLPEFTIQHYLTGVSFTRVDQQGDGMRLTLTEENFDNYKVFVEG